MLPRLRILPLLSGLVLGTLGAWLLIPRATPPAPRSSLPAPNSDAPPAPAPLTAALQLPPRLAPAEADTALDAWLALSAPASWVNRSAPVDFATLAASLHALLVVLPDDDFPRLLSALTASDRPGDDQARLRQIAFTVWTERAPADAARWIATTSTNSAFEDRPRLELAQQAARAWARLDFEAAFAWSRTLDPFLTHHLPGKLLSQLAATDPARALALAHAAGDEFFKANQLAILGAWKHHDPAAALQTLGPALLAASGPSRLDAEVIKTSNAWLARDPAAALAWILANAPADDTPFPNMLLRSVTWEAGANSATARPLADLLATRSDLPGGLAPLSTLLSKWMLHDHAAALAWLDTLPNATRRAELIESSINPHDKQPARDLPLALRLPEGQNRIDTIGRLLGDWTKTDPDAALAWLRAHDDPSLAPAAASVQKTLLATLAATDPAAAVARWQALPDSAARAEAVFPVAQAWAKTDPAAATQWLADQLPPLPPVNLNHPALATLSPEEREAALKDSRRWHYSGLGSLLQEWAKTDPDAALAWAETIPDPKKREGILRGLIPSMPPAFSSTGAPDPLQTATLINRINDPAIRTEVLSAHIQYWMRSDLVAARDWLENHYALTPDQAARLLAEAELPPP